MECQDYINNYINECVKNNLNTSWRNYDKTKINKYLDYSLICNILEQINIEYTEINNRMDVKTNFFLHLFNVFFRLDCCICCLESSHSMYKSILVDYLDFNPINNFRIMDLINLAINEYDNGEINCIEIYNSLPFSISILRDVEKYNDEYCEQTIIKLLNTVLLKNVPLYNYNISFYGFPLLWISKFKYYKEIGINLLELLDINIGLDLTSIYTYNYLYYRHPDHYYSRNEKFISEDAIQLAQLNIHLLCKTNSKIPLNRIEKITNIIKSWPIDNKNKELLIHDVNNIIINHSSK